MAYTINKTDGTILANVPDGQIDRLSSDLTLIGKNYSGFGEALNENLVKLLENFASTTRPPRPVRGQIWFDATETKLKVYTGTAFVPVSSATIANSRPSTLGVGDLWFNNVDKQLYFFDGIGTILLGPDYSSSQGISGIKVQTVLDKTNSSRVITLFYTNGTLIGIFSKDQFIPKVAIQGFNAVGEDKIIYPGFNAGTLENLKFTVTASNAERLDNLPASEFARKNSANIFEGQISIRTNEGISIGDGFQAVLQVDIGNVILSNTFTNKNLELKVRKGVDPESAIEIVSLSREIRLYKDKEDSVVTVGGSLVVTKDLTVNGTVTTINSTVLEIVDKSLELAKTINPSDANADGGGIILKGDTDHSLLWTNSATAGSGYANLAWNSTEHLNLVPTSEQPNPQYKINGIMVLSANSLGSGITSLPGVREVGTQLYLNVGPGTLSDPTNPVTTRIEDNRISTQHSNLDIELAPHGQGDVVLIGYPKIQGLFTTSEALPSQTRETANPQSPNPLSAEELSEATTKRYVTNFVRRRSIVLSININEDQLGPVDNVRIADYLTKLAPPAEYENNTTARILCTSFSTSGSTVNLNTLLTKVNNVEYNTPTGTGFPVQDLALANATIPAPGFSVTRVIKTYELIAGTWTFLNDTF
jgi:hypothetical protein